MKMLTMMLLILGVTAGGGAQADDWTAGDKKWTVVHDNAQTRTLVATVSQRFDQEVTVLQMNVWKTTTQGRDYTLVLKKLDCSDRGRQTIVEERSYLLNSPVPVKTGDASAWHIINKMVAPETVWAWDAVCGQREPEEKALTVLPKGQTFEDIVHNFRSNKTP